MTAGDGNLGVTLANWRQAPYNVWAFRNVGELVTLARVAAGAAAVLPAGNELETAGTGFTFEGQRRSFDEAVAETETDSLLVLHRGKIVWEQYRNGRAEDQHLMFSVSKSITAILAGVLVGEGKLDPDAPVTRYVPEVAGSAYGTATVRHVLDMTVAVDFVEDYLDTTGSFARYRVATAWNPPRPEFGELGLHAFLGTLPMGTGVHGQTFHYVSPNSDLLGWIVERAGGASFAELLSNHIWKPMGAEFDAAVTVDNFGAARTAGGICVALRDLARFGEMIHRGGRANNGQVVPKAWIDDIWKNGDPVAWERGTMTGLFPDGRYRSKWYATDSQGSALCAIGIHGQWIFIDPRQEVVVVKQSSQKLPSDERVDRLNVAFFTAIASACGN